ncbi:hypothetical protein PSV08DRAFT_367095 [Bipolaris maydis]|nr:hypothetical protein J3E73DRAFT_394403 [Bipolaris maydis]KAJ6275481.1 hypothetical protein PSV08DRAFT_367095 [Bipolaris maydis]
MGVTEIAILPIQEGKTFDDTSTADGRLHAELLKDLLSQPGCQRCYWGRQVENKNVLRWFIDWDRMEHHRKFIDSDAYKYFVSRLSDLLGGAPRVYHAYFNPNTPFAIFGSTTTIATEIVNMYFPTSYSNEDKTKVANDVSAFIAVLEREETAYRATTCGWVEEDVDIPGTTEKTRVFVLLIGRTSVDAHLSFRNTKAFAEYIHLLHSQIVVELDAKREKDAGDRGT